MLAVEKKNFEDSIFQKEIFRRLTDDTCHMVIDAKAGSGKTTTIVRSLKLIPIDPKTKRRALSIFLAFNKDIVKEAKTRCPEDIYVSTLHSWGWKEIRFRFGNTVVKDDAKISKIIKSKIDSWGLDESVESLETYAGRVEKIVNLMRFALPQSRNEILELCEKHEIELVGCEIDHAKQVLLIARADTKTFDFTDMIYFPAVDWNNTFKCMKFKYVFVDECQDLNPMQHALIKKLVCPNGGRMIAVGDPNQSIYGFAGADIDSFDKMKTMFPNTVVLPLSFSYRCASEIVKHAQVIVPQILPAPDARLGEVRVGSYKEVADGDFILCRNTKPLVSLCLKYIAAGRKATIKGGDIGRNLINMVKRTKAKTHDPMFKKLEVDLKKLKDKTVEQFPYKEVEKIPVVVNMVDKIEALHTIGDACKTKSTDEIISTIERIFSEESGTGILLSTMHKSKGLEADNVFILEANLIPAVYAVQEWQRVQEENLEYVARTRAKKQLVYIDDYVSDQDKMENLQKAIERKLSA
jgi:DNA helicase-2/ATP-dependent DNA helicase PcrA